MTDGDNMASDVMGLPVWPYSMFLFQCGGGGVVGSVLVCCGCRNKVPHTE